MKINNIYIKSLILLFLIVSLVCPLFAMFVNLGEVDVARIFSSPYFVTIILNTVTVTLTATILSVFLAFISAWLVARSNIKHKRLLVTLFTIPMLIPSISHGTGLIVLFGNNGVITNLLNINFSIYGFWGIVVGSLFYSFPVAFLMFYDSLQYEDGTVYLAANVLGIPKYSQLLRITLPYLRKSMIAVFFSVFTLIFTDYGIPLMIGGKYTTLPLYMYNEVIGLLDFGKGALIGCLLMIPAFIAFLVDVFNKENTIITFHSYPYIPSKNKRRDIIATVWSTLLIVLLFLPILVFFFLTFIDNYPISMCFSLEHIARAMNLGLPRYLGHSLIISLFTAILGTFVSYITAYFTARTKGRLTKLLHLFSMISMAVPGIVLGLSYIIFFQRSPIYGTISILILVNSIHFFASPYLMAYNALNKLNPNYEGISKTLGISQYKLVLDVFVPQTLETILEQFSFFFVNSMVTISAVSFLSVSSNQPLSLMIPNLESMMLIGSISFVSILILMVNLIMKALIHFFKKLAKEINSKKENMIYETE